MENDSDPTQDPSEPTPMPPEAVHVQNPALTSPRYRSAQNTWRTGLILLIASPLIAIAPIVIALIMVNTCPGGAANANEGNCSWAALPWMMFMTVPAGAVLFIIGVVMMTIGSTRKSSILREGMR